MKKYLKDYEYKILYKRIIFTCWILLIYIFGTHIPAITTVRTYTAISNFYKMTAANVGGDYQALNVFSLGLGPWLTAMIFMTLFYYRDSDRMMKQTRREKSTKERIFTLILALIQAYFVVFTLLSHVKIDHSEKWLIILVLVTGAMILVWLSDLNMRFGIAGPMPIVMISIIRSIMRQNVALSELGPTLLISAALVLIIILLVLIFIEITEYRLPYLDVMDVSSRREHTYLAWKLNPGGSIAIMISFAAFFVLNSAVNLIVQFFNSKNNGVLNFLDFSTPIGITIFLILQLVLSYGISRLILDPKRKAKDFKKNGDFFPGVEPGKPTYHYLIHKARRISWIGAFIVTIIIGIPLYATLLIPQFSKEIYLSV
ncbi:accessory Sec system protein translocase subunit SecY2 [Staphylococcus carnosus]|uniref:Accessory Sec system protein translocase subunit SecY2 n=2 Tax=Staphylococcus carnosus TaxID=1281 RepID=SECY2_STACT|nr:RecName: Full=Accessory Sec system protein translocase subunit SecY2 [Staphylococcus carnosus subsp. carnosus TM300]UTB86841.1 accessory Sec system protein translocase subunit SecY2 [Staphylococcus carnosus]GEP78183.1 accessory Sec system protein translocase subunit SecY2 [Staphylococcus carnosus]CAL29106.1 putative preprotein translocase secY subunit [Staphylococcus carnosus subsp. carnosus TM300]SUL89301.1 preprotein translocase subunit SecY [Staphylococcus carnosus]